MKKILFNEIFPPKIINGEKTMTRRIIKPQPTTVLYGTPVKSHDNQIGIKDIMPRYKVGEVVYIAEPYKLIDIFNWYYAIFSNVRGKEFEINLREHKIWSEIGDYIIKRFDEQCKSKTGYCNKLFTPEFLADLFIEITDVRAERLQKISDEDCIKEGIKELNAGEIIRGYSNYIQYSSDNGVTCYDTPRAAFAALIDKINGRGTWESNPYVWVYTFKFLKDYKNHGN
ncbi:MAG: hypothetical protein LBC68_10995 [Prevotellaceae bacterium]|jgi:hypothetical protein|nr:hypothetical protein [Prevotellaceae bacterium]